MATGPVVPITAKDYTGPAWASAEKNAKNFGQTMSTLNKVVGGFGALGLVNKLGSMAGSMARAVTGLGDFILEAKDAGAAIDTVVVEDARALSTEVGNLTTVLYEAGVALTGPFVDDIRSALSTIRVFVEENMGFIKAAAQAARDSAAGIVNKATTSPIPKALGAHRGIVGFLDDPFPEPAKVAAERENDLRSSQRLGSLTAEDRKTQEAMIKEEAQAKEKAARELQRDRDHAERKRAQEQEAYERDFQRQQERDIAAEERRVTKEAAEIENQQTHATMLMESLVFNEEQRLAAVDSWQARELKAVGDSKAAQLRIIQQAEHLRRNIEMTEQEKRARARQRDISAGLSLLGVAFGKNKGFALAEAAINMWTGATAELRSPAPGKFSRVAMVIASGLRSIMAIKATNADSSGGGSIGTGGGGGGGDFGGVPTAGYQAEGNAIAPAKVQPRGTVEVHFTGNVMLPEFTREHILPEIRSAVVDNYDLKIFDERGVPRTRSG